jgi:hypothetical protein
MKVTFSLCSDVDRVSSCPDHGFCGFVESLKLNSRIIAQDLLQNHYLLTVQDYPSHSALHNLNS